MIDELLECWFGELDADLCSPARRRQLFRADPDFDDALRAHFGIEVEAALAGERDHWGGSARGRLALVLLLDQLPRNLFRGTPRAFAGDAAALVQARQAVAAGQDRDLPLEPRLFLYLPFEHAEDPGAQRDGIALLEGCRAEQRTGSDAAAVVDRYLGHARDHAALIATFGRFPHRNEVLGRSHTEAERAHLARDARSFGQG